MIQIIQKIFSYEDLILKKFSTKKIVNRDIYKDINSSNKIIWIIWLRWVWKTTFLLKKRQITKNSIYITCDLINLKWFDFLEIIKEIKDTYNITTFFLDEIHFLENWSWILKNIYDILDIKVIFSWSSMINILHWKYDLSRRVIDYNMPIFSFREFLNIYKWYDIKKFSLDDILNNHVSISKQHINIFSKTLFDMYLNYWQFWYFFEDNNYDEYLIKLENSLKKSIYEDLSQIVDISSDNLSKLEKLLYFIANTSTSELSQNSLSKNILITVKTIWIYLWFLENLWWIIQIWKYWNVSDFIRKQNKIYFSNTNILNCFWCKVDIWNYRENFFLNMLNVVKTQYKFNIYFQSQTDFIIQYNKKIYSFEIWWKNKKRNDNIFIIKDDILMWKWNEIPLWLFGFLY